MKNSNDPSWMSIWWKGLAICVLEIVLAMNLKLIFDGRCPQEISGWLHWVGWSCAGYVLLFWVFTLVVAIIKLDGYE